jgi:predicted GIY-YIG superfamily endonuclease
VHFVCLLRDTGKKRNSWEVSTSLADVDRRLKRDRTSRKSTRKVGELLLVYHEGFRDRRSALERKSFLESAEGRKETQLWLQRWDKTEMLD